MSKLTSIFDQRKELEQKLEKEEEKDQEEDILSTSLELNLNQLREYYAINKKQSKSSFRMGVVSVLLGLIAILIGVGFLYARPDTEGNVQIATVTAVAGLLGQFIGGSCSICSIKPRRNPITIMIDWQRCRPHSLP
jgi:hypothetical protein